MSLNLTFIPIIAGREFFLEQKILYPTERVSFSEAPNGPQLLARIGALSQKKLPKGKKIVLYERDSRPTRENPYGETFTFLYPNNFTGFELPDGSHKWDRSVLEFLKSLPEDTPIIIYWH